MCGGSILKIAFMIWDSSTLTHLNVTEFALDWPSDADWDHQIWQHKCSDEILPCKINMKWIQTIEGYLLSASVEKSGSPVQKGPRKIEEMLQTPEEEKTFWVQKIRHIFRIQCHFLTDRVLISLCSRHFHFFYARWFFFAFSDLLSPKWRHYCLETIHIIQLRKTSSFFSDKNETSASAPPNACHLE